MTVVSSSFSKTPFCFPITFAFVSDIEIDPKCWSAKRPQVSQTENID